VKPIPAVVTPFDEHMGLDIARSLGRRSIPVFGIDWDPEAPGRKSKYSRLVLCPDPKDAEQEYAQFLVDWGKRQPTKSVLYPVSDDTALICSRERRQLQPYYEFVMPDHEIMVRLSIKASLANAARACDIPTPQTILACDAGHVPSIASGLSFPVILKPVESSYWHIAPIASLLRQNAFSGRAKVVLCHSASELCEYYSKIAVHDRRMIIQEVIPGPDENLAYISFYLDRMSRPLAIFAGRKLRVLPIGFGSASYVRSYHDSSLEKLALRLLQHVQYQGLGGIEFKMDPRDGLYKLIEFNTRFGMWDGLAPRCGVDTPYVAYCDTLRLPIAPQLDYRDNVIWLDWQRDVRAFWMYRKERGLSFRDWFQSLRGEKMWAIYDKDDWQPGIAFTLGLLHVTWSRFTHRESRNPARQTPG
jgi:D-aspartate ligase